MENCDTGDDRISRRKISKHWREQWNNGTEMRAQITRSRLRLAQFMLCCSPFDFSTNVSAVCA